MRAILTGRRPRRSREPGAIANRNLGQSSFVACIGRADDAYLPRAQRTLGSYICQGRYPTHTYVGAQHMLASNTHRHTIYVGIQHMSASRVCRHPTHVRIQHMLASNACRFNIRVSSFLPTRSMADERQNVWDWDPVNDIDQTYQMVDGSFPRLAARSM